MRWFALSALLVTAACASPSPTTLCPERYSEVSELVRNEALSEADIVFALDSSVHAREHFARVVEALDVLVAPLCISRTEPGGGTPVVCDPNNPDHVRQYPPIPSLRIGFVSADLGASGSADPACDTRAGADGQLARTPDTLVTSSSATISAASRFASRVCEPIPRFLEFCGDVALCDGASETALDDRPARAFLARVRCAAEAVGATGCRYAQPLEALRRALVDHGAMEPEGSGSPNAGFVRRDALLALVVVTVGEDHSVRDCSRDQGFSRSLGFECIDGRDALRPRPGEDADAVDLRFYRSTTQPDDPTWNLDRYVTSRTNPAWSRSFDALKPGHPERIVFVAVTGAPARVPTVPAWSEPVVDYDELLGPAREADDFATRDPSRAIAGESADGGAPFSMRNERDPRCPHVVPACRREGVAYDPARSCASESSVALPARRLIEVVRRFDESPRCFGAPCRSGTLVSVCNNDLRVAFRRVVTKMARRLGGKCIARPVLVRRGEDGLDRAECVVRVTLPAGQSCDPNRAMVPVEGDARWFVDDDGVRREVCEVLQAPTRWEEQPEPRTVPVGEGWFYDRTRTAWNPTCDRAISYTRRVGSTVGFILRTSCMFDHGIDPSCSRSAP